MGVHYSFIDAMDDATIAVLARRTGTHPAFWREMAAQAANAEASLPATHFIRPIVYGDYLGWCEVQSIAPPFLFGNQFAMHHAMAKAPPVAKAPPAPPVSAGAPAHPADPAGGGDGADDDLADDGTSSQRSQGWYSGQPWGGSSEGWGQGG